MSIAAERVFGQQAEAGRQAQVLSAFTALVNVFFISFSGLIPSPSTGLAVVILGSLARAWSGLAWLVLWVRS